MPPVTPHSHIVLLQAHHLPERVSWLIDHVSTQGVFVVVHVDAKATADFETCAAHFADARNVHFLDDPVKVNWSGFSQVRATLKGIEWIRTHLPDFDYLHLLSGECLPLLPFVEIDKRLRTTLKGKDLIECRLRPGYEWRINRYNILGENPRNRQYYFVKAFKWVRDLQGPIAPRKNFPVDGIFFGSQWWSFRKASLERMLARDMNEFAKRFRWTRCADEHFFQILFAQAGLEAAGSHRYADFQNAANPKYLLRNELFSAAEGGAFFARKVDLDTSKAFVEQLQVGGALRV